MESCGAFDGTSGDAQACSSFQFIKEARSAFSAESAPGFFGRIKPAEGFLALPLDLLFYSRSICCKMPVGFQALAAVTVNHWTQFSSDHETDPAAKAARVMDFHASSLVLDFLLNRQAPIPSLVSRKGYCYKMGLTHTVSRQSLASDFLHHSVAFFALAFEISAASFLFPYPF